MRVHGRGRRRKGTGQMEAKKRQASKYSGWASNVVRLRGEMGFTLWDVVGLLVCNPVHAESFYFLKGKSWQRMI